MNRAGSSASTAKVWGASGGTTMLAGAYPSAGAADAADDLAFEDLKTLFLEAVAVQRSAAAAGLHDRLGSQHLA